MIAWLDQPRLVRENDACTWSRRLSFVKDVSQVRLDRRFGQEERGGDLGIRKLPRDEPEQSEFALG